MGKRVLRSFLGFFILLVIIIDIIFFFIIFSSEESDGEVCFDKGCFNVEIADEANERVNGLMGRENLDKDDGMLFIFDKEEVQGFWMKNTLISLDIIWIGSNNEVVYIKKGTIPCVEEDCEIYFSNESALYVLEINAGMVEKFEIKEGDKVEINL